MLRMLQVKKQNGVVRMILEEHKYNQSNVEPKKEKKEIMRTFHNPRNDIYHNYNN